MNELKLFIQIISEVVNKAKPSSVPDDLCDEAINLLKDHGIHLTEDQDEFVLDAMIAAVNDLIN